MARQARTAILKTPTRSHLAARRIPSLSLNVSWHHFLSENHRLPCRFLAAAFPLPVAVNLMIFRRIFRRYSYSIKHRNGCLNYGFLILRGSEINMDYRATISAQGLAGWFTKDAESSIDYHKKIWLWDSGDPFQVVTCETNKARFHCRGFYGYAPGRSPQEHMTLESEHRTFARRVILAIIAAGGAVVAAWIVRKR